MTASDELRDDPIVMRQGAKSFMLPPRFNNPPRTFTRANYKHIHNHELSCDGSCRQVVGYNLGEGRNLGNAGSNEGFHHLYPRVVLSDRQMLPGGEYRGRSGSARSSGAFCS